MCRASSSFFQRRPFFQKGMGVQDSKREATTVVFRSKKKKKKKNVQTRFRPIQACCVGSALAVSGLDSLIPETFQIISHCPCQPLIHISPWDVVNALSCLYCAHFL